MIDKPGKYKKGKYGYMMDFRRTMGRLGEITREWCRAFDAGDSEALEQLVDLFEESQAELKAASVKIDEFDEKGES